MSIESPVLLKDVCPSRPEWDEALEAVRCGRPVILKDDADRENEGDLIIAAQCISEESMAMLIRECSGIVCLCLTPEHVTRLELPQMVTNNQSRYGTAFTVSIEAREGISTGVSAADRVSTIRAAIHPEAQPQDLASPGHVFPLRAHPDGIRGRRGHTEGSVELARLAGLAPAAVLCELMNPDGSMARGADIDRFAAQHHLPVITMDDVLGMVYRQ